MSRFEMPPVQIEDAFVALAMQDSNTSYKARGLLDDFEYIEMPISFSCTKTKPRKEHPAI
jgi:hypothetical protein